MSLGAGRGNVGGGGRENVDGGGGEMLVKGGGMLVEGEGKCWWRCVICLPVPSFRSIQDNIRFCNSHEHSTWYHKLTSSHL